MNKALWGKLGQFKWALVTAIVVLLTAIFSAWHPVKYPAAQAYVVGSGNCRGQEQAEFVTRFIDIYENSFRH